MNPVKFNLVQSGDTATLTAFFGGEMHIADNSHPGWAELVAAVTTANESTDLDDLASLFDPSVQVSTYFQKVSERVSIAGGRVFFDGEELSDALSDHIIRYINEGNNAHPLINFMEKVQTNPNEHSREQLYEWLRRHDFTITSSGNFLAYKGVRPRSQSNGADNYPWESINSGTATVDGVTFRGAIPNGVGAIVEMPRGSVQHDPSVGCHTGLHAGTYEYANSFAQGKLLLVEINPRDVVSVPTDCSWAKIRTCRYTVVDEVEQQISESYWAKDLDEDYSDEEDYLADHDDVDDDEEGAW